MAGSRCCRCRATGPFQLRDLLAQCGDPVGLRAHRLAQFLGQVPKLRDPFLPCGAPGAVL